MFMPEAHEIYPEGDTQPSLVTVRLLSNALCSRFHPGHFDGVATVVTKLFDIVGPDVAIFDEKDYQQFLIIRRMTSDLAILVEVVGAPTVRAPDGLALSSRNRNRSADERARAPLVHAALQAAVERLVAGERDYLALESRGRQRVASVRIAPRSAIRPNCRRPAPIHANWWCSPRRA